MVNHKMGVTNHKMGVTSVYKFLLCLVAIFGIGNLHGDEQVKTSALLNLEAGVMGSNTLYPGQKTKLFYQYRYKGDIELAKEVLPLLDADGLIKIGEKEFHDSADGDVSVSRIIQEVRADKPGVYSFGPSSIEGNVYDVNDQGVRVKATTPLTSVAPAIEVKVMPFPSKGKPSSFTGAIGIKYEFTTSLLSSSKVDVGDEVSLELTIIGNENIQFTPLPNICCQDATKDSFRMSDLPPAEQVKGVIKKAIFKMSPLNAELKAIPSIEFSYFNPDSATYTVLRSQPIPIKVIPLTSIPMVNPTKVNGSEGAHLLSPTNFQDTFIFPSDDDDLHNHFGGTWWALGAIPFSAAIIIYQLLIRHYLQLKQKENRLPRSRELFQEVISHPNEKIYFDRFNGALKMAMVESRLISDWQIESEDLPKEGVAGEIRNFLLTLDEKRFSSGSAVEQSVDCEIINREALRFINQLNTKDPVQSSPNDPWKWIYCLLPMILILTAFGVYSLKSGDTRLNDADKLYDQAHKATTLYDTQLALNGALNLYLNLEQQYQPVFGNGKLYFNIAETYFQLGEYSWAVLYYERAHSLLPRSEMVDTHLANARRVLNLQGSSVFVDPMNVISLPERLQLTAILTFTCLMLISFYIWNRNFVLKCACFFFGASVTILLLSLSYSHYLAPTIGVLITSSEIHRQAVSDSSLALDVPVPAGSVVEVLDASSDGSWIKIVTSDGHLGYIPEGSIRLLWLRM